MPTSMSAAPSSPSSARMSRIPLDVPVRGLYDVTAGAF